MKGSRLLLQVATKPSLPALSQAPLWPAHGAVFFSNQHIYTDPIASSSKQGLSLGSSWLSSQRLRDSDIASVASDRHPLLLSGSPTGHGEPNKPPISDNGISDHEYQTRVGKACRVIVDTLPDFMQKGVVDLSDIEPDCASSSTHTRTGWSAKNLLPSLSPFLGQSLLRRKAKAQSADSSPSNGFDSLYHPSIAFEFRPPLPHIGIGGSDSTSDGSPAKRVGTLSNVSQKSTGTSPDMHDEHSRGGPSICFNGRTMYVASSHLLRHALSALFHDTSLHLESARFEGRSKAGSAWPGISPFIKRSTASEISSDGAWQDKLVVRLRFEGISRVSSHPHTYTVIFKYEFDRKTGMIGRHVVDNIQPVPGSKVWAGLSHAWGNLTPAGGGAAPPAACSTVKVAPRAMQRICKAPLS